MLEKRRFHAVIAVGSCHWVGFRQVYLLERNSFQKQCWGFCSFRISELDMREEKTPVSCNIVFQAYDQSRFFLIWVGAQQKIVAESPDDGGELILLTLLPYGCHSFLSRLVNLFFSLTMLAVTCISSLTWQSFVESSKEKPSLGICVCSTVEFYWKFKQQCSTSLSLRL